LLTTVTPPNAQASEVQTISFVRPGRPIISFPLLVQQAPIDRPVAAPTCRDADITRNSIAVEVLLFLPGPRHRITEFPLDPCEEDRAAHRTAVLLRPGAVLESTLISPFAPLLLRDQL